MPFDVVQPEREQMMAKPAEAEKQGPPNLRDALSEASICGTCSDFQGMNCKKYGTPVKFHEGCDDHSDMREGEDDAEQEEAMPASKEEVEE